MDKRKNNGAKKGENRGQGRKSKADESRLIEQLDNIIDSKETDLSDEKSKLLRVMFDDSVDLEFLGRHLRYLYSKVDDPIPIKFELKSLYHTVQNLHSIRNRIAEKLGAIYTPDEGIVN